MLSQVSPPHGSHAKFVDTYLSSTVMVVIQWLQAVPLPWGMAFKACQQNSSSSEKTWSGLSVTILTVVASFLNCCVGRLVKVLCKEVTQETKLSTGNAENATIVQHLHGHKFWSTLKMAHDGLFMLLSSRH